jgi:hypothetical protein
MDQNGAAPNHVICTCDQNTDFDGIFSCLTKLAGKNPLDAGVVTMTSAAHFDPFLRPTAIVEPKNNLCFYNYSGKVPTSRDNWIEFDFASNRIEITAYALKWCDRYIMTKWDLIGSNDRSVWSVIHSVRNEEGGVKNGMNVFKCQKTSSPYRYIRYVQHGNAELDGRVRFYVQVAAIEFFGTLYKH